jgi:transposase InsO family protein
MAAALRKGRQWKGAKIVVRKTRGRGGTRGVQLEARIDSLPQQIQARIASRVRPSAGGAPGWSATERELRHDEFTRKPAAVQERGRVAAAAVRMFHNFAGSALSMAQRYAETARATGVKASTIRVWVKRCQRLDPGDWHVALAPRYRGGAPSAEISPGAWSFIQDEYLTTSRPALKRIYERGKYLALEHGWTLPSYATVNRMVQREIPRPLLILKREGSEAFDRLYSGAPRDYSSLKLNELWCCDGHKANCWVRMEDGSIVRPIIIAVEECRSRRLIGCSIARSESAEAVMRAWREAIERTRDIPDEGYIDNSMAFASKLFTGGAPTRNRYKRTDDEPPGVLALLGIKQCWARPYNAKAKPVESLNRIFTEMVKAKRFEGAYCGSDTETKPEDCDPSKAMPIADFRAAVAETVAHYNSRPHRGDAMHGRSPLEVYQELAATRIARAPTTAQLRLCFMGRKVVKLSAADGSINLHGNRYWTKELASLSPLREYVVGYDPEDATQPLALYSRDGAKFLLDVPLQAKTGFRSAQAAKERAAALRRERRATLELEAARRAAREARTWQLPTPEPEGAPPEERMDSPKVVRLNTDPRLRKRAARSQRLNATDALTAFYRPKTGM